MDSTIDHATQAELNKINERLDVLEEKAGITKEEDTTDETEDTETTEEAE